jgi:uncharacterized protein YodC (DUF2158 family)
MKQMNEDSEDVMLKQLEGPLRVGDTVRLRSGSPVMTIGSITGDAAHCIWFSREETVCSETFGLDVLWPVEVR